MADTYIFKERCISFFVFDIFLSFFYISKTMKKVLYTIFIVFFNVKNGCKCKRKEGQICLIEKICLDLGN